MSKYQFGSIVNRDFRNTLQRLADDAAAQGKAIQDLVAEGQLTEEQYSELISVVNGLVKSGHINRSDLSPALRSAINSLKNKINKGDVSLDDLKPSVLEAINNGDGTPFEILSIPRDNSVSEDKTTFIDVSTNLVNTIDGVFGKSIDEENGEVRVGPHYRYLSPFFAINPGEKYVIRRSAIRAFYDENYEYISSVVGNGTFTTSENTRYIRIATDILSEVQLNKGHELLPYEPYYKPALSDRINIDYEIKDREITSGNIDFESVGTEHLKIIGKSTNLVNKNELLRGYSISPSTGEQTENSTNYVIQSFIPAKPNTSYIGNISRYAEYDKNFNFINTDTRSYSNPEPFKTGDNTAFLKVAYYLTQFEIAQLNEGTEMLPYEEFYQLIDKKYLPEFAEQAEEKPRYIFDNTLEGTFSTNKVYPDYTRSTNSIAAASEIYDMYENLMNTYPHYISKQYLGDDGLGNSISLYRFKHDRPDATRDIKIPKIFITCGTHGHEHITPVIVYEMLKQACEEWEQCPLLETLKYNVEILVIPVVNPSGWDEWKRVNHNGVDINRNFPADWSEGTEGSSTYGGPEPLSELESQYVKQVFDENPDIDIMVDYHNFHGSSETTTFLWLITSNGYTQYLAQSLINKMTRKWRKEYDFIPEDDDYFVGTTSGQARGLIATYADSLGIELSVTYENCWRWRIDENSSSYDDNAIRTGIEGFTNWLILNCKQLN